MLEVLNLVKNYKAHQVLDDVSFSLDKGEVCGLIGPNGAGKSTLMKIICQLEKPNRGAVLFNGEKCSNENKELLIGYMIESPSFYEDLTGRQNLLLLASLYDSVSKNRVDEVLSLVGLNNSSKQLFKNYSMGMKQRLYFAYSIINHPNLLILDEPFNGVDPITCRLFKDLIIKLSNEGCTVLVSSQIMYDIKEVSKRVIIIDNGKLVYNNLVDELDNLEELYISNVSTTGEAQ